MSSEHLDKVEAALAVDSASLEELKKHMMAREGVELELRRQNLIKMQRKYKELREEATSREEAVKHCEEDFIRLQELCSRLAIEAGDELSALHQAIGTEAELFQEMIARRDALRTQLNEAKKDSRHHQALEATELEIAQLALDLRSATIACEEAESVLRQEQTKKALTAAKSDFTSSKNEIYTPAKDEVLFMTGPTSKNCVIQHPTAKKDQASTSPICELTKMYEEKNCQVHGLRSRATELQTRLQSLRSGQPSFRSEAKSDREKNRHYESMISDATVEQVKLAIAHFRGLVRGRQYPKPRDSQFVEYVSDLDSRLAFLMTTVISSTTSTSDPTSLLV